jgi:hypothetical protein
MILFPLSKLKSYCFELRFFRFHLFSMFCKNIDNITHLSGQSREDEASSKTNFNHNLRRVATIRHRMEKFSYFFEHYLWGIAIIRKCNSKKAKQFTSEIRNNKFCCKTKNHTYSILIPRFFVLANVEIKGTAFVMFFRSNLKNLLWRSSFKILFTMITNLSISL